MATAMVTTLSAAKQRRSLGETSKKEKAMKKPTRTTVVHPREIEWPDLDEDASKEMIILLEESMKCLKIPNRHVPLNEIRPVPTSERSDFRKKWVSEAAVKSGYDISNYTLLRTTISLGVNCVSKALELDQLVGVVIEKEVDPQIITKLLIPIANSKGVPIISLSGLNATFKNTTGIRCIALGFKKPCENVTHEFYNLLQAVRHHAEKINMNESVDESVMSWDNTQTQHSVSLLSSQSQDEELGRHPVGPISIEEEVAKLTKGVRAIRRSMPGIDRSGFIPPKIRRVTPK